MASKGINKVIIVGNLGQDPETRFFPDGGAVSNVSVATSEAWKDKNTGEDKSVTEWHRLVFNGKLAEIVQQWLKKGSKIYVEGKLRTRKWQNQQGVDQYTTEIVVREMQMLGGNEGGQQGQQGGYQNQGQSQPQSQGFNQHGAAQQGGYQQNSAPSGYQKPSTQSSYQNQHQASQGQQQGGMSPKPQNQGQQSAVNPQEPIMDFDDDIPFAPVGLMHNNNLIHVI